MSANIPTQTPESEEAHFAPNQEMQDAGQIDRFTHEAKERSAAYANLMDASRVAKGTSVELATSAAVLATAGAIMVPLAAGSIEHQADKVATDNQNWSDQAEQNIHQQQFEEGLDHGKVTIEVPSATQTTIPSPEQESKSTAPALESPKTH